MHTDPDLNNLQGLVAELEQLDGMAPWQPAADAAREGVAMARAQAYAVLFPETIEPHTPEAYSALEYYTRTLGDRHTYVHALAAVHGRAIGSHPDLAKLLRSPEALATIHAAAASRATVLARSPVELAHEDSERYIALVAGQLAASGDQVLAEHAAVLVTCQDFTARIDAAVTRHKERAAAELARMDAQRRAVERERAKEAARRAAELNEEARQLSGNAIALERRARLARAENLAARIRALGLTELRVDRYVLGVDYVLANLATMSTDSLDRFEQAIAAVESAS